jgi:hypothetical protein
MVSPDLTVLPPHPPLTPLLLLHTHTLTLQDMIRFRCKHRGDEPVHPVMKKDWGGGFAQLFRSPKGCINTSEARRAADPRATCYFCGGTHAILLRRASAARILEEIDTQTNPDIDCK